MSKLLKYIFFLLLLIFEFSINAQSYTLGVKLGSNYSNIEGYYSFISTYRQSFSGGVFLLLPMSKHIESSIELNFEQKGFKYFEQDFSDNTKTEGERIYDYLTIPTGFKYKFGKNIQAYFKVGIFLAIMINATDIGTETNYTNLPPTSNKWENSIMYKTEPVDFGTFFSFGIQSNISTKFLFFVEGNLNYGLIMLEANKVLVEEMRNRSFLLSFGLGYKF